ncbi:Cytochrome c4 [hydrothermal vent metagenome]|uniref:Cytochrome c4 n=1 Tax=hydrothermal vent metagenome TaxID=652676 RepID=A0A3B0XVE0_9ZZZZ
MKKQVLTLLAASVLAMSASSAMAGGDAAKGKAKAASCGACHGADGISKVPTYPNLKGQKSAYVVKQLKAFKSGARKDPTMNAMSKPLSDADMANLAAYYESLK